MSGINEFDKGPQDEAGSSFNLEEMTKANRYFRLVIDTSVHSQTVLMALDHNGIEKEIHPENDQFFKVEEGLIEIIVDDIYRFILGPGDSYKVRAGHWHQVYVLDEQGRREIPGNYAKLYTIYSPPHHRVGTMLYKNDKK